MKVKAKTGPKPGSRWRQNARLLKWKQHVKRLEQEQVQRDRAHVEVETFYRRKNAELENQIQTLKAAFKVLMEVK